MAEGIDRRGLWERPLAAIGVGRVIKGIAAGSRSHDGLPKG